MVVQSGLSEGERVIVEGIQKVRPGMAVAASEAAARRPRTRRRRARGQPPTGRLSRMISNVFIERPRLAFVISIVITLAGLIAIFAIPLAQFPDIVPPQVQVSRALSRRQRRGGRADASPSRSSSRSTASTTCST